MQVILYLHHKRTLYIWSYSKPWLRDCCFPIPPPDDMVYDVFVSYSSDDREFVEDLLVQQLEHGNQSQSAELRYKCLMAIRDFNPGENILKQGRCSIEHDYAHFQKLLLTQRCWWSGTWI